MTASWRLVVGCLFMVLLFSACDSGTETSTQVAQTQTPPVTNPPDSADGVPGVNEIDKAGLVIAVLAQTSFSDLDRVWFLDATGSYDDEARATLSAHVESDVKFVADAEDAWGDAGRLPEGEILLGFTDPVRLDSASR